MKSLNHLVLEVQSFFFVPIEAEGMPVDRDVDGFDIMAINIAPVDDPQFCKFMDMMLDEGTTRDKAKAPRTCKELKERSTLVNVVLQRIRLATANRPSNPKLFLERFNSVQKVFFEMIAHNC